MRLLNGTSNSILDEAFQSAKLNETRWHQSIHTLRVNGFAYVLDDSLTFGREVFPRVFKQRCTDIYYQNTIKRLENSPKFNFCYNYMVIKQNSKNNYKYQPYLDKVKNIKHRKIITRLRCSAHILEEEKGRHLKINKDQRTCKQCSIQEIEDLNHLLINCNTYTTERRGLLDILKETYAARYDLLSDDAKCFKLLNMEVNPQFVDRCAAQIHLIYKKEGKLVIEK